MYEKISEWAREIAPDLSKTRRDFHENAESGWFEMRTTSKILRRLDDLGYDVISGRDVCRADSRMGVPGKDELDEHFEWARANGADERFLEPTRGGFTGAIATLHRGEGPTVAFRFDIDALGVFESEDPDHAPREHGFASKCGGTMHACGHDGHAAIGLGVAELLMKMRDRLRGTIKLIFQPAEEGVRGAKSIVDAGHLDDVDFVAACHVSPSADGSLYVSPGRVGSLATTKLDAIFSGGSAHAGARPEGGRNALIAAATAVLALHAIPRHSAGASRVNVGRMTAGSGRNVIPDRAKLEIEVRGQTSAINSFVEERARLAIEHAAAMYGCSVEIAVMGATPSLQASPDFAAIVAEAAANAGLAVRPPKGGVGGSEDYAYMAERVIKRGGKSCFSGVHVPTASGAHTPRFDFDERALALGVKLFAATAWRILGGE